MRWETDDERTDVFTFRHISELLVLLVDLYDAQRCVDLLYL